MRAPFALYLLLSSASAALPLCSDMIALFTSAEGMISFDASNESISGLTCAWRIIPTDAIGAIEFNTTVATFGGNDYLSFYTSLTDANMDTPVGYFDRSRRVPSIMVLTGSAEAVIVMNALHRSTALKMYYRANNGDPMRALSKGWFTLWLAVWCASARCSPLGRARDRSS